MYFFFQFTHHLLFYFFMFCANPVSFIKIREFIFHKLESQYSDRRIACFFVKSRISKYVPISYLFLVAGMSIEMSCLRGCCLNILNRYWCISGFSVQWFDKEFNIILLLSMQDSPAEVTLIDGKPPLSADQLSQTNRKYININSKNWQSLNMDQACENIAQWEVVEFNAYGNKHPSLLKSISLINFKCMVYLNVWGNNITSVESLCRVQMPMLERLWIWDNQINCFRDLRKGIWPNLEGIDAKNNPSRDHEFFAQIKVKKMKRLHVGCLVRGNCLAKMESTEFTDVTYSTPYRSIKQGKFAEVMRRKAGTWHS